MIHKKKKNLRFVNYVFKGISHYGCKHHSYLRITIKLDVFLKAFTTSKKKSQFPHKH